MSRCVLPWTHSSNDEKHKHVMGLNKEDSTTGTPLCSNCICRAPTMCPECRDKDPRQGRPANHSLTMM